MPFKFRLEVVLKLRKEQEREIQMQLAALRQQEFQITQRLGQIAEERRSWVSIYNEEGKRIGAEKRLLIIGHYFSALDSETARHVKVLKDLNEQIDEVSAKAKRAYRATKQIEHIRDLQKERYELEKKQKENRDTAELVALRFVSLKPEEACL